MTTEEKAQALVDAVRSEYPLVADFHVVGIALSRAIEQHEAFRQEVSEFALGVREYMACCNVLGWQGECDNFIILAPKPDPLGEAMLEIGVMPNAPALRAALEARGFEIREKNDG